MAVDSSNLGSPEAYEGLPLPGSPVTSSGEDPDELRERLAAQAAQQQAAAARVNPGARPGEPPDPVLKVRPAAPAPAAPSAVAAGQLGGAGRQPSPAAPSPAMAPTPAGTMEPAGYNADVARQAMSGQLEAGKRLNAIADQTQVDPQIAALQQKELADQAAAPNPQAAEYRPGFGTRVLRGLRATGMGLAEHGIFGAGLGALDPAAVGATAYGAPNDAYDVAAAKSKAMQGQDAEQLANAQSNFKLAQDLRAAQEKATQEGGEAYKGAGSTATGQEGEEEKLQHLPIDQENADTEKLKASYADPDNKLKVSQAEVDQRTKTADSMHMTGYLRNRYILTGEIQPAREATAEEVAVNRLTQAFRAEHGGQSPKTVADWQGIYAAAKGGGEAKPGDDKNLREAVSLAEKRVKDATALMGSKGAMLWSPEEKTAHQAELDQAKQEFDTLNQQLLGGSGAQGGGAPGSQPKPQTSQFSPDGTQVMVDGRWRTSTGPDGKVRMKLPDGRFARFPAGKAPQAAQLGATFAGGA